MIPSPRNLILQIRKQLADWRLIRAVGRWRSDRIFARWKRLNPHRSHADFYAEMIESQLRKGKSHATLGSLRREHGDSDVEWTPATFGKRGGDIWRQILAFGLEPQMRTVDYGCGSLRLGQHAIAYLNPRNYFGVDVSDAFIEQGKQFIDKDLLRIKQPRFGLLGDDAIEQIARWNPDFIFSNAVLTHVPPDELGIFFKRLQSMMTEGTQAFVIFVAAPRLERLRSMTWGYPFEDLWSAALIAAPSLRLELRNVDPDISRVRGGIRRVLVVNKGAPVTPE